MAATGAARRFPVGAVTVWAIADAIGSRSADLFPDADPAVLAATMPGGSAPSATMVFALVGPDSTILIDSGYGGPPGGGLGQGLAEAGIDPAAVDRIVLTHLHGDHIGGLVADGVPAFPNARVLVNARERDFWLDDGQRAAFPARGATFDRVQQVLAICGAAVATFPGDDPVAPNLRAVAASGHSPGHTAFLLESDGEKMLFLGDLVHAAALQFAHPAVCATYDLQCEPAVQSRRRLLDLAARSALPVAGCHLPFPGIGRVSSDGTGVFQYHPW